VPRLVDDELARLPGRLVVIRHAKAFPLTRLELALVRPERGAHATELGMIHEDLRVVRRIRIGIERQDFFVRTVRGSQRLEFPAAQETPGNPLFAAVRVTADPADLEGFEGAQHAQIKLTAITQVPDLDRQRAAGLADAGDRDKQRREEPPAAATDHDAALVRPGGRLGHAPARFLHELAKRFGHVRIPIPAIGKRPGRLLQQFLDPGDGTIRRQIPMIRHTTWSFHVGQLPLAQRAVFRGEHEFVEHAVSARQATAALPAPRDVYFGRGLPLRTGTTHVVVETRDFQAIAQRAAGHQPFRGRTGERHGTRGE